MINTSVMTVTGVSCLWLVTRGCDDWTTASHMLDTGGSDSDVTLWHCDSATGYCNPHSHLMAATHWCKARDVWRHQWEPAWCLSLVLPSSHWRAARCAWSVNDKVEGVSYFERVFPCRQRDQWWGVGGACDTPVLCHTLTGCPGITQSPQWNICNMGHITLCCSHSWQYLVVTNTICASIWHVECRVMFYKDVTRQWQLSVRGDSHTMARLFTYWDPLLLLSDDKNIFQSVK